jgi:hypothetical protein
VDLPRRRHDIEARDNAYSAPCTVIILSTHKVGKMCERVKNSHYELAALRNRNYVDLERSKMSMAIYFVTDATSKLLCMFGTYSIPKNNG